MSRVLFFFVCISVAQAETFDAHCRDRSPTLIPIKNRCTGPVAEIVETAIKNIGHDVAWQTVPWARSIKTARYGNVDLIPKHSMNKEREGFLSAVAYGYKVRLIQ